MRYDRAVYRPLGDLYLTVEFGDELSVPLNLRVIALDTALRAHPIHGVTETIPTNRSLGIVYDPFTISRERLVARLTEIEEQIGQIEEVPSRHVTIPVWYNDPWSQDCAAAHGAPNNLEFLAEINKTTDEATCWRIRRQVEEGTYQYQIREETLRVAGDQPSTARSAQSPQATESRMPIDKR